MIIYKSVIDEKKTRDIYILGLRIFKRWNVPGFVKRSYFWGIFKTESNKYSKKIYFLRIHIFTKNNKLLLLEDKLNQVLKNQNETVNKVQSAIMVANQHSKVFPQFKNIHKGKVAVVMGTGPTLNQYIPIKDAIHIGVNRTYQFNKVKLDYLFTMHYSHMKDELEAISKYDCIKFIGQTIYRHPYQYKNIHYPDSTIDKIKNSYKYYLEHGNYQNINIDIETQLLPDLGSCIFQAMYFTLYTGVNKIYLVGCDSSPFGYFTDHKQVVHSLVYKMPSFWKIFKSFCDTYYPDVEIISINPVGLKGLFPEIYMGNEGEI